MVVLRKLGLDVHEIFRHQRANGHRPFTPDEHGAFERRTSEKAAHFQGSGFDWKTWLTTAWHSGEFNQVLLLVDPDTECNFDQTILRYGNGSPADAIVFLRINLFVRLWRKLGWTIEELDRALHVALPPQNGALTTANIGTAFKTALLYLAHFNAIHEQLPFGRNGRQKLLTFWSHLSTTGHNPLYAQLFLNQSVSKHDPVFDDPLGQYLSRPGTLLKDHQIAVQGALNLTAHDVEGILMDAGQSTAAAPLSLENVSLLYRYGLLAKALKTPVDDVIRLKSLSGLNPFCPLKPGPITVLEDDYPFSQTLRFIEIARIVRESGFHVQDLDYLLRHRFDPVGKYRQDPQTLLALIKSLAAGLRSIQNDQAVPMDTGGLTDEMLQQKLALVLPSDAVTTFMGMWTGAVQYEVVQGDVPPASKLDPIAYASVPAIRLIYDEVLQAQRLSFRGVLTDEQVKQLEPTQPPPLFSALLAKVQAVEREFYESFLSPFLSPKDYQEVFCGDVTGFKRVAKRGYFSEETRIICKTVVPLHPSTARNAIHRSDANNGTWRRSLAGSVVADRSGLARRPSPAQHSSGRCLCCYGGKRYRRHLLCFHRLQWHSDRHPNPETGIRRYAESKTFGS